MKGKKKEIEVSQSEGLGFRYLPPSTHTHIYPLVNLAQGGDINLNSALIRHRTGIQNVGKTGTKPGSGIYNKSCDVLS